ncbi:TPD1 protein homolog 1-like [Zingiber officinale]|uniref:TPD1 protein homolog 1-like n=1 Tax=Zingiber officinale TaxID=94328 RepID=UPI001C4CE5D4|nr:TPD1 protein homolog 1-like [Zingiber officinale]
MKGAYRRLFATAIPAFTLLVLFAFVFFLPQVHADCSIWSIKVDQIQNGWLNNGEMPIYSVAVRNNCDIPGGCRLGDVHLTCADFNPSFLIDPDIFRHLSSHDCLLMNGANLTRSGVVASFEYAYPKLYPINVSSVTCFPQHP